MKRWLIVSALLFGLLAPAAAFWQSRDSNYNVAISSGVTYQGPGDVFSSGNWYAWHSCARAFNAAYANGTNVLCEVQRTSDNTKCSIIVQTNGFANTTATNCNGNTQTIAQFCNATTCGVDKAVDQTGNGRDELQATQANQPTLSLSSTPTGTLPAINCGTGSTLFMATASTFTVSTALTFSAVLDRTTVGAAAGGAIGAGTTGNTLGHPIGANTSILNGVLSVTASDNAWHAIQGLSNGTGTSSAVNVDSTDTLGNGGATIGFTTQNLRLCRAQGEYLGLISEAGFATAVSVAADRNNLSSNQHSATNGYNF